MTDKKLEKNEYRLWLYKEIYGGNTHEYTRTRYQSEINLIMM